MMCKRKRNPVELAEATRYRDCAMYIDDSGKTSRESQHHWPYCFAKERFRSGTLASFTPRKLFSYWRTCQEHTNAYTTTPGWPNHGGYRCVRSLIWVNLSASPREEKRLFLQALLPITLVPEWNNDITEGEYLAVMLAHLLLRSYIEL